MRSASRDRFGIAMLYSTDEGGRAWSAKWDNGFARTLSSGDRDIPYDSAFVARGSSTIIAIDGSGVARLSGIQPRMYVYEDQKTWNNVEITFYAKRRDLSEGENGGEWERLLHEADNEDWPVSHLDPHCTCLPTQVLTWPASSVFIRNTEIDVAEYSKFSIREIDPE